MRVAITGVGSVSSLGNTTDEMFSRVLKNETAVKAFPEWRAYKGLSSFVGAPASPFDVSHIPRSARRSMSRMSEMAVVSTTQALESAVIKLDDSFRNCLIFGSTTGSPFAMEAHFKKF